MMSQNVNTFAPRKNTVSIAQKIDRNNLFRNLFAKRGDFLVRRMNRIKIQSGAVGINRDKSRIERTIKMQDVAPDAKAQNIRNDIRQCAQFGEMFGALGGGSFRFVFPTNNMCQHTLEL